MNNTTLHTRVQYLEQKITELLASYREQKESIQQLRDKNALLMQQLTNKAETAYHLVSGLVPNTIAKNKTQLMDWEATLDAYISDIDKSIAYLEKM
jgi:uncharacterized coiled-coil protein SlyX